LFQYRIAVLHHLINLAWWRDRFGWCGRCFRTGQFVGHSERSCALSPSVNLLQIFAEKHPPAQAPPSPRPPRLPPPQRTNPIAHKRPAPAPSSPCPPSATRAAASKLVLNIPARLRLRRS